MQVEFADEPSDGPDVSGEDVLTSRSTRLPSWFVMLLIAGVAAIAVVVIVERQPASKHAVATSPSSSLPSTSSSPVSATDEMLAAIYEHGRDGSAAHDVVRGGPEAGSCKLVRVGTSPQRAAALALQRQLPAYRVIDSSRIIDQSAGLCGLQVRGRDDLGNVVLIMVTSPAVGPPLGRNQSLVSGAGSFRNLYVEYAQFTTPDGWTVVVGTSGPNGVAPSTNVLDDLASNPALRW